MPEDARGGGSRKGTGDESWVKSNEAAASTVKAEEDAVPLTCGEKKDLYESIYKLDRKDLAKVRMPVCSSDDVEVEPDLIDTSFLRELQAFVGS